MPVLSPPKTREERRQDAYTAGCKGRSAQPMSDMQRLFRYGGGTHALTPAQRKRYQKKARALAARESK